MHNAVWFISYRLKKNVSVEDFLKASAKCNQDVLSKQKGYLSWEVLRDGDTWVDLVKWENSEDAKRAETAGQNNPASHEFYSMIEMNTCKQTCYAVEIVH